ncbi:MAG: TolB family protein, partial [Sciscionella sp.]
MIGTAGMSTRVRTVALAGVVAMLFSVPAAETGLAARAAPAPSPVAPSFGRIAYAATGHRSLGRVASPSSSVPLFGGGPEHFDEQASARGDLLVFTSLRHSPKPQVYLRDAGGAVRRLTTNRDAAHPRLSPDGRFVVFDSAEQGAGTQRDLWLVRSNGSGLRRLTDTAADETSPTVSPDGTRVAFSSNRDSPRGRQIYQQPLAGGPTTRVTDEPSGAAVEPTWNPVDDAAHRDLIAYTLDTGGRGPQVRLTDGRGHQGPLLAGEQESWQTRAPAWLPDGDGVLFLSPQQPGCICATEPFDMVYRSSVRSDATPRLVLKEDRAVDAPTWLGPQDGGGVVVARTSAPQRNIATLQDIQPDGTDPRDLGLTVLREDPSTDPNTDPLFNPAPGFDPWTERQNYSPDGRKIVVTRFEDSRAGRIERIWMANADGSAARPLGLAGRGPTDWDTDPTFSPDGRLLAFARKSPGGVGQNGGPSRIMIADVASGAIVNSVPPPPGQRVTNDAQPTWSSDGTMLAFTRDAVIDGTSGNKHIWTVPVNSLNQQRDLSATICPGDCEVIDDSPAFSPDSRTVAFNRKDGAGRVNERDGILIASLTGGGCQVALPAGLRRNPAACGQELPDTSTTGPFQPRDVAWSADAKRLVLTSRRAVAGNSPEGLSTYDIATGTLTPLDWRLPGRQKEPTLQQSVDLNLTAPRSVRALDVGGSARITAVVTDRSPAPSPGTALTVAVPSGLRLSDLRT